MKTNGRTYEIDTYYDLARKAHAGGYEETVKRTAIRLSRSCLLGPGARVAIDVYMVENGTRTQIYQAHLSPTTGKIIVEDIGR